MSFSIAEDELKQMNIETIIGHYSASNYFQSLDSKVNQRFVANFKKRYGANRTTNASMEAAYSRVHLWAKAVIKSHTDDVSTVRQTLKGESYQAPEGNVTISALNNHLWKPLYIGQVQADGQFKIVWSQTEPIRPLPYPSYRTRQSWQQQPQVCAYCLWLQQGDQILLQALVPVMLAGALPTDKKAYVNAINEIISGFDLTVAHFPPTVRAEIRQLLWLLESPPTRSLLTGVWSAWHKADVADINGFIESWKHSRLDLLRVGYAALHDLIAGAWYANPLSWKRIHYPGPPTLA